MTLRPEAQASASRVRWPDPVGSGLSFNVQQVWDFGPLLTKHAKPINELKTSGVVIRYGCLVVDPGSVADGLNITPGFNNSLSLYGPDGC